MAELILGLHILILASFDVYQNIRIIKAYTDMARKTSEALALTEESRNGFREFFLLCGFGTHGIHVLHLIVDVAFFFLLAPLFPIPTLLYLLGSGLIHWRQAQAAELVLNSFFSRDMRMYDALLRDNRNKT